MFAIFRRASWTDLAYIHRGGWLGAWAPIDPQAKGRGCNGLAQRQALPQHLHVLLDMMLDVLSFFNKNNLFADVRGVISDSFKAAAYQNQVYRARD